MPFLPTLDDFIKLAPISFALISVCIYCLFRFSKNGKIEFIDLFVVGTAGSSIPSGILLIYGAFDQSVIAKISDSNVYIAFAGIALLYVAILTVNDKFKATT